MSTSKVAPRTLPALQLDRARKLRKEATPAERKLWSHLRASNLDGHKFSRQIAIGPFIADLVCRRLKVVIEVDGGQHGGDDDARRTRYLQAQGYIVLRFWNLEVLTNVDSVLTTILGALQAAERTSPLPLAGGAGGGGVAASSPPEPELTRTSSPTPGPAAPSPPASGRGVEA